MDHEEDYINDGIGYTDEEMAEIDALRALVDAQITHDDPEELQGIMDAAYCGDLDAQIEFGDLYFSGARADGIWIKRNAAEACAWYKRAADQGHPLAKLRLSEMYFTPHGTRQTPQESFLLIQSAADCGYVPAIRELALVHLEGYGVAQSSIVAARLFAIAANSGDEESIRYLRNISGEASLTSNFFASINIDTKN